MQGGCTRSPRVKGSRERAPQIWIDLRIGALADPATSPVGRAAVSIAGRRKKIATGFTITLENQPGQLARLSKALGDADVNIRALSGMVCEGKGVLKLLTSDEYATREKLAELGLPFIEREILTVTMPDRPGQLGDFAQMIAEAGINIETIFVIDTAAGFTELAIGVDKVEEAKALPLGQF